METISTGHAKGTPVVSAKEAIMADNTPATTTVKALAIRIADAKDMDPADAAKLLRRRIRRDFDKLAESWTGLDEAKENRDGNRYPPMPSELADAIFATVCPAPKDDDEADDAE